MLLLTMPPFLVFPPSHSLKSLAVLENAKTQSFPDKLLIYLSVDLVDFFEVSVVILVKAATESPPNDLDAVMISSLHCHKQCDQMFFCCLQSFWKLL